jgi:3-isopropylmalate/(R)-2-methylmalate dehydratase small subunit
MASLVIENPVIAVMGDDVDTDILFPTRFIAAFAVEEVAKHVLQDVRPDFVEKARSGGIVIAGKNFGCGSAREQAASGLKGAGVKLIIAPSFSRSFYRNGINVGLPLLELGGKPDIKNLAAEGDKLRVDFGEGTITNLRSGLQTTFVPPSPFIVSVLQAGGICNLYTQTDGYKNLAGISIKG